MIISRICIFKRSGYSNSGITSTSLVELYTGEIEKRILLCKSRIKDPVTGQKCLLSSKGY